LIAHVSATFLLPVFKKSVIINDFRAIAHCISAREGGNTLCWNAIVRNKTDDDSATYWFPWKHPTARRRWLEFGVFDQTPPKTGSSARPYGPRRSISFPYKTTTANASAWPFGPRHSHLLTPLHENTTQMWARPCGLRLWSVANAPGANFSPFRCPPRGLGHAALDSDHAECDFVKI